MAGSKKQIHGFAVTDGQIVLLSTSYALKGVLIRYGVGWLDFNICCASEGGAIYPSVISRLVGRKLDNFYAVMRGTARKGLIYAISPRRYAITDLGREVVAYYWERYNFHRDTIIELERERLRRLGIED